MGVCGLKKISEAPFEQADSHRQSDHRFRKILFEVHCVLNTQYYMLDFFTIYATYDKCTETGWQVAEGLES